MATDDELYPGVSPKSWVYVGQSSDGFDWNDDFAEIRDAHSCLMDMENVEGPIDWDTLVRDLPLFSRLATDEYGDPPLRDFVEFEQLSDLFLVVDVGDDLYVSCVNLYLTRGKTKKTGVLRGQFAELARRLRAYPPLRDVMGY